MKIDNNADLKKLTTFKMGGTVSKLYTPETEDELEEEILEDDLDVEEEEDFEDIDEDFDEELEEIEESESL